ncbi:hypothetical protein AWR38_01300 [Idiomarina sp. WRN-38]|nr:hypothetical protein AUR68_01295 [Idiomarina sp. H105]OAE96061.1 hypothetical protein AWR38_01300 [Idiomarina sp. WRN-38]
MIDKAISKLTGRRHHFKLLVRFTPDRNRGQVHVERVTTVWMREKKSILDERDIRKQIGPSMVKGTPRRMLKNGGIDIRAVYYLGWFRPVLKTD